LKNSEFKIYRDGYSDGTDGLRMLKPILIYAGMNESELNKLIGDSQ
jgi:predicted HAD superfamily phosphohydrolase